MAEIWTNTISQWLLTHFLLPVLFQATTLSIAVFYTMTKKIYEAQYKDFRSPDSAEYLWAIQCIYEIEGCVILDVFVVRIKKSD